MDAEEAPATDTAPAEEALPEYSAANAYKLEQAIRERADLHTELVAPTATIKTLRKRKKRQRAKVKQLEQEESPHLEQQKQALQATTEEIERVQAEKKGIAMKMNRNREVGKALRAEMREDEREMQRLLEAELARRRA
ncbi:hypothetical protein LTR09_001574 [Extremus antarcticus]|uniref:Uncharacterized protein n=1 Tax=Extremus antarcticus TaxID=702011 RepID=A0AAJ0LVU4_9PEZI|nr:hypothetical protein LTR09_001574 [Extremus antarcticus]